MPNTPLILGIDGGGTKCQAVLYSTAQQKIIGAGLSGPANPVHGIETTQTSIINAAEQALHQANLSRDQLPNLVVGAGLAGVNLPKYLSIMQEWAHPFKSFSVTTDLHIASYGAHNAFNGAAIIVGTGSCGIAINNANSIMVGGHGFSLGDKGSGAWLGLQAVQHALEASDGLAAPTQLTELILAKLKATDPYSIVELLSNASPATFGTLAPLVFTAAKQGDNTAQHIIREGAHYISALAEKLLATNPPRLSMLGGLAHLMHDWLDPKIQIKISPALGKPEQGAILFALNNKK